MGIAGVLTENRANLVAVQQNRIGLGGFQAAEEQAANSSFASAGQTGEKLNRYFIHLTILPDLSI